MQTAFTGLAGKYGRVRVNSTNANLNAHEARPQGDDLDTTHFESDVDTNSPVNVYEQGLVGIISTEIMIRGLWDGTVNYYATPFFLFPGLYGTAFLGLTKTFGFTAGFRCLRTPVGTEVRRLGTFEAGLKANGLITPPSGLVSVTGQQG